MNSEEYWKDAATKWESAKKWLRYPGPLTYVSWPVPELRGERRVVISPYRLGYRWYVSDSSQLTLDGPVANYGEGTALTFGAALTKAEQAALR